MDKRLLLASPHMSGEGYELEYINDAFRKNWIAPLGENVNEFEKAMGTYMGKGYPVALSAGTAALHLAMILAGVKRGDAVFCQSLTFSASANPVVYCGAKPVFIDSSGRHGIWIPLLFAVPLNYTVCPRRWSRCICMATQPSWMKSSPSAVSTTFP